MSAMKDLLISIFARPSTKFPGAYDILHVEDGAAVTRIEADGVYPVVDIDDDGPVTGVVGCRCDHPDGITLTAEDVACLSIEIE